jgi:hypothetical protein
MRINWKPVRDFAELVGGAVSYVLIIAAYRKFMEDMCYSPNSVSAHYDDAVKAIMDCGMYSHDKADAVAALKRYGTTEFYRAIVHIAEDDSMFSHDKLNMIKALSEN